ncbi:MAG: hypothetical protein EXR05_03400 [Acetobacteraceae bacterium]|nr:hypothetical protein [Acetobacteraceae bacterium]MSP30193.1 hypothetical protein [Acetobacteraceae bacterium]
MKPIFLPSRSPELNPVENIWQCMRPNWLFNRVFDHYDAIVKVACEAWKSLHRHQTRYDPSACAIRPTWVRPSSRWYYVDVLASWLGKSPADVAALKSANVT